LPNGTGEGGFRASLAGYGYRFTNRDQDTYQDGLLLSTETGTGGDGFWNSSFTKRAVLVTAYMDDDGQGPIILFQEGGATNGFLVGYRNSPNTVILGVTVSGTAYEISSSSTYLPGDVLNIFAAYDGDQGFLRLWVNGRLEGEDVTGVPSSVPNHQAGPALGGTNDTASGNTYFATTDARNGFAWGGTISSFAVTDRVVPDALGVSLSANPWQIFAPRIIYVPQEGGTPVSVGLSAAVDPTSAYVANVIRQAALSELAEAAETLDPVATGQAAVTEPAEAGSAESATATGQAQTADTVDAADAVESTTGNVGEVTGAADLADQVDGTAAAQGDVAGQADLADAITGDTGNVAQLVEAAEASDSYDTVASAVATILEAADLGDTVAGIAAATAQATEAVDAADAISGAVGLVSEAITESVELADAFARTVTLQAGITSTVEATAATQAVAQALGQVSDAADPADVVAALAQTSASVSEQADLSDAWLGIIADIVSAYRVLVKARQRRVVVKPRNRRITVRKLN